MGEHRLCKAGVEGSIPFVSIPHRPMPAATTGEPRDHVTGLASRGDLQRTLERAVAAASAADASKGVAVAICDIVGLKGVNEMRGFGAGDAALFPLSYARSVSCHILSCKRTMLQNLVPHPGFEPGTSCF